MAKPLTKSEAVRKANAIKIANPDFTPAKIKAIIEKQNGPLVFDGEPFYFKTSGKGKLAIESVNVKNARKARANTARTASAAKQTAGKDVYKKGVVTPKGSKFQEHHKRALAIYAPFFEGLNDQETKELAQWFVDEGAPLGNVKENLEALPKKEHNAIHNWMRENLMEVNPKNFPSFKNYSLNERFVPALTFLEQVQPAADEQLELIKGLENNLEKLKQIKVPRFASQNVRRAAGLLPFAGAVAGSLVATGQAIAGETEAAKVTAFETAAGEVPIVGDIFTADPVAAGTLEGAQQQALRAQQPKSTVAKILDDPMNELEYISNQLSGILFKSPKQ